MSCVASCAEYFDYDLLYSTTCRSLEPQQVSPCSKLAIPVVIWCNSNEPCMLHTWTKHNTCPPIVNVVVSYVATCHGQTPAQLPNRYTTQPQLLPLNTWPDASPSLDLDCVVMTMVDQQLLIKHHCNDDTKHVLHPQMGLPSLPKPNTLCAIQLATSSPIPIPKQFLNSNHASLAIPMLPCTCMPAPQSIRSAYCVLSVMWLDYLPYTNPFSWSKTGSLQQHISGHNLTLAAVTSHPSKEVTVRSRPWTGFVVWCCS